MLDVPSVGGVTGRDILTCCELGAAFDGDSVVVLDHDQVAQLLMAGESAGFGADAFLNVAVGAEDEDAVIERAGVSGSRRPRSRRAPIAMPTAVAMPS
jgi:hypothetical protein